MNAILLKAVPFRPALDLESRSGRWEARDSRLDGRSSKRLLSNFKSHLSKSSLSPLTSNFHFRSGQSLVEAMAAVAIALLIITALVALAIGAVRSATASKNRVIAVSYATEGMEAVRTIRDRSFSDLPPVGGPYQLVWSGTQWDWAGGEQLLDSIFTRSFTVNEEIAGKLVIALKVNWIDTTGNHRIDLVTYLTDWR